MKRNFTLAIPTPCHEKWDQFTPTQKGRFCSACQKEVIDFTTWSEEQIKQYFNVRSTSTCGRFAPHQLTTYKSYQPPQVKPQTRWAAILAFLCVIISRPAEAQEPRTRAEQEQLDSFKNTTTENTDAVTQLTIRGVVVLGVDDAEQLPGVNVVRKGTTQSVVTDADGKFEMVINHSKAMETLVFSFIGLRTVEYQIPADSVLKEVKITMPYDITQLGGITVGGVVAYPWYSPRRIWWGLKSVFRRK